MRESTNWSRSWRVRLNFLARLKNKFNKKVDEFFVNEYFDEAEQQACPPVPPPPTPAWTTVPQAQFETYHEASGSNHTSTQNSQYFDAEDAPEYLQQHQIPRFEFPQINLQGQSAASRQLPDITVVPSASGFHQDQWEMYHTDLLPLDHQGDGTMLIDDQIYHLPTTAHDHQSFLQDFDHHHEHLPTSDTGYNNHNLLFPSESCEISGYSDAVTEMQRDEYSTRSWHTNINYSQEQYGAPSVSMQMSGDTVETVDSNMMDTGDSNFTYILPPHPVHQRRTFIKKNLTFEDVKRILFDRDAGSKFRVVASIVCAYRKFRELLRRKRMQRSTNSSSTVRKVGTGRGSSAGTSCKLKRIKSADCCSTSRGVHGIKQRKGKWVAEIRVSKMADKVWLGSFPLQKQAALAYDAGLHHCSTKRTKIFNFKESPQKLGPSEYFSLLKLTKKARKERVQQLACDYAMTHGS